MQPAKQTALIEEVEDSDEDDEEEDYTSRTNLTPMTSSPTTNKRSTHRPIVSSADRFHLYNKHA